MIDYYNANLAPNYFSAADAFTANNINYPSGWLRTAPLAEKTALGFQAVTYGARPDDQWHWVQEVRVGPSITYTGTPKDDTTLRSLQSAILTAACKAAITEGFTSSALGASYTYPSQNTPDHPDQTNLAGSVIDAQRVPPNWTAGETIPPMGDRIINGQRLLSVNGGVCGTTLPAGPGDDGTVTWVAWYTPFWCADALGNWAFRNHTAVQILQVGADGKTNIVRCQMKLANLNTALSAASGITAIQAVVW